MLGIILLRSGNFRDGFLFYESRWRVENAPEFPRVNAPLWDGRADISGKHVLVCSEQGIGDMIQFARFAKSLEERGATVSMGVRPSLSTLFESLRLNGQICRDWDALPCFDYFTVAMSLPMHFEIAIDSVPYSGGYPLATIEGCHPRAFRIAITHWYKKWSKPPIEATANNGNMILSASSFAISNILRIAAMRATKASGPNHDRGRRI
ncbi:MAG: hypothetical protein JO002_00255 [Burkholderiaceae bacterium]|nr:hypothetical protein [Burkholderiaceae bacterium]